LFGVPSNSISLLSIAFWSAIGVEQSAAAISPLMFATARSTPNPPKPEPPSLS
jgi:hypothetical protein